MKHPWRDFAGFQYTKKDYIRWRPRNKVTLKEVSTVNYNYKYLKNNPRYGKYYEEYKVHCWVPPLTVLPPQDYSICYDGL